MAAKNTGIKRVGKFGLVGILNTLIDLGLFNILSSGLVGLALIPSNLISTTVAMIFSFFANQRFVFAADKRGFWPQAIKFFVITAFGLYVLQSGVIYLLTNVWHGPVDLGLSLVHLSGLGHFLSDDFAAKNGVKAGAILVSLTWNYMMYKKVVFKS